MGLTDTVGMLVLVGLLLSLSAVILHRVLLSHGNAMEYLAMTQNLQAAHDRWTEDALTSRKCEIGDDLKMTCTDGRQISYALESGQLVRSTSELNRPDGSFQIVGQEHWQLPEGCQLVWSIDRKQRVPLVVCNLQVPNQPIVRWVCRAELPPPPEKQP